MQRRYNRADPGRRSARRQWNQLSPRAQSECRLHARALDHDHRPVRAHSRRRRQRRRAAARLAERRRVSPREGRLPHRAAGQGALRARVRFAGAMVREQDGRQEFDRSVSRLRSDGTRDAHTGRRLALLAVDAETSSRRDRRLRADSERDARRRHRRARSEVQSRSARALPHRLGRTRARSRISTRSIPTTTGSYG